ncbi:MAG: YHS domain protein [bacterium]|nr:YHS domain protein [bacterium]
MLFKNFSLSLAIAVSLALGATSALQAEQGGVALAGYDTVAYFTMNKAVKGKSQFQAQYLGKTWNFANANHKKLFEANPAKYAPQYGGYCAWGIAEKDDFFPSDPTVFAIHGGKLYLNYNSGVAKNWNRNRAGFIKQGDANYAKSKQPIATEVND